MKLTRRVAFSSGHRYWHEELSEEENRNLFGRWASPYNHGHNYVLDATFEGKINEETGMVVNIKDLDEILQERIVKRFDQKSINDEVPELAGFPPTLEVIVNHIWSEIAPLPPGVRLSRLRLYETPTLYVEMYQTDGSTLMTLTRTYEFCASHRLHVPGASDKENLEWFGKCNNPSGHGHNYELEVTLSGPVDPKTGMMVDLTNIDNIVNLEVVDRYDHKYLNVDIPEFRDANPTSEVIVKTIWQRLEGKLPIKLERILLRETARNFFEYSGEDE
jgi:6-pyruvoyltetrahydropterin/6-carboxytetrahydropterin synthase